MNKINAECKNLASILLERKYTVDYFQREYGWKQEHIDALVSDLCGAFFLSYNKGDERGKVEQYGDYYLGSLLISDQNNIIDGQQRLTSMTLLLIYLKNRLKNYSLENGGLERLIYSEKYGTKSFNIQVEEREECFKHLFENPEKQFESQENSKSVKIMLERYGDIENSSLRDDINEDNILHFIDWLGEKVIMTVITTASEDEAYKIFETMNDRGLNLTSSEMLKAFLLANVDDHIKRGRLNNEWKNLMVEFHKYGKDGEVNFFQGWLRGKYAETIRDAKKQAVNEDFEKIGTKFHVWVKENLDKVGIGDNSASYSRFIENMLFYARVYLKINEAQNSFKESLDSVYYINDYGIAKSLSYPLMIAPINIGDEDKIIQEKISLVAKFIEIFVVRKSVNQRRYYFNSVRYYFYNLVKEIRGKDIDMLRNIFSKKIEDMKDGWDGLRNFVLNSQNKRFVKFFLSRLTSFVEIESGDNKSYVYFFKNKDVKIKSFEIEHIWANKYEQHRGDFDSQIDFENHRNKIGGLILLPRGANQSYGSREYGEKVEHYLKENILAKLLHSLSYKNNPNFLKMFKRFNLPFKHYDVFTKQSVDERTELYIEISDRIWGSL